MNSFWIVKASSELPIAGFTTKFCYIVTFNTCVIGLAFVNYANIMQIRNSSFTFSGTFEITFTVMLIMLH